MCFYAHTYLINNLIKNRCLSDCLLFKKKFAFNFITIGLCISSLNMSVCHLSGGRNSDLVLFLAGPRYLKLLKTTS